MEGNERRQSVDNAKRTEVEMSTTHKDEQTEENGVTITPVPEISRTASNMGSRGPYLKPAKLTRTAAKGVILEAIDFLDTEAERLRTINNELVAENERVKKENEDLKHELSESKLETSMHLKQIEKCQDENLKLREEVKMQIEKYKEEKKRSQNVSNKLLEENAKFVKQIENFKKEVSFKSAELATRSKEIEMLNKKVDQLNKSNKHENYVEMLHNLEVLKNEKRDIILQKEKVEALNMKLKEDIVDLEKSLEGKTSELSNEGRRHSILTKEFNSLLQENNRLKQQMKDRGNNGTNKIQMRIQSSTGKSLADHFEETNQEILYENSIQLSGSQQSVPVGRRRSNPNLMARSHTPTRGRANDTYNNSTITKVYEGKSRHNGGGLPALENKKY